MTAAPDLPVTIRVLVAVGDRELEGRLVRELPHYGVGVAGRCLDAPGLIEQAAAPGIDAVLISAELHRLSEATLLALRDNERPAVLLTGDADLKRYSELAHVLPVGAAPATIAAALTQAKAGGTTSRIEAGSATPRGDRPKDSTNRGRVLAVASGKGAPGKTTIAIALAAELSRSGSATVLVDADLRGGNVAPCLDLDPRRGLVGLGMATGPLTERVADELQDGPGFAVLAGIERPELAAGLGREAPAAAVAALRERHARVVVDLGVPAEPSLLRLADDVLIVTGADLVSVWNTRVGLAALRANAPRSALHAVVNRREGGEHYGAEEIEHALDTPLLAIVREDRKAARRAIAEQRPLSAGGGRIARDLRALATVVESPADLVDPAVVPAQPARRAVAGEI